MPLPTWPVLTRSSFFGARGGALSPPHTHTTTTRLGRVLTGRSVREAGPGRAAAWGNTTPWAMTDPLRWRFRAILLLIPTAATGGDPDPPDPHHCVVGGVALASCFGHSATDATAPLQAALDSGAGTVVIDAPQGRAVWPVRPLQLRRSDLRVLLREGVVVEAVRGSFHGPNDSLLTATNVTNASLVGMPGAALAMHRSDYANSSLYSKSEHRMALQLLGVRGFLLSGLVLRDSGGDGVYISDSAGAPSENVRIANCTCLRNFRQGMSVISARNLMVEHTVFAETAGTPPEAGVE